MKSKKNKSTEKCINPWFGFLTIFIVASITVFGMFEVKSGHLKLGNELFSKDDKCYDDNILITSTGNSLKFPVSGQYETCKNYIIVDPANGKYMVLPNNSKMYTKDQIRNAIKDNNIGKVITGTMNPDTYQALKSSQVDIYAGVTGTGEEALKMYGEKKPGQFTNSRNGIKKTTVSGRSKRINSSKRAVF